MKIKPKHKESVELNCIKIAEITRDLTLRNIPLVDIATIIGNTYPADDELKSDEYSKTILMSRVSVFN